MRPRVVHEREVESSVFQDRWSKDLLTSQLAGFSLGIAQYHSKEFGTPQIHGDQEALYVVSGVGDILLDEAVVHVESGTAIYVPSGCRHAARTMGDQPLLIVYAHASSS
jgi:mannose-6-phosphate isomerase-like protein (cupin superfamily)